jgi:hypothetical protein
MDMKGGMKGYLCDSIRPLLGGRLMAVLARGAGGLLLSEA